MPTTYWLTAETMAQKYGLETAINTAKRMTKIAPKHQRDFWRYVLASLERMEQGTAKPSN